MAAKAFTNSVVVKAGTIQLDKSTGAVFSVQTATGPLLVSFDGGPYQAISSQTVIDNRPGGFNFIVLSNTSATDITISYVIGDTPVLFTPSSQVGTVVLGTALTTSLGNFITTTGILIPGNTGGLLRKGFVVTPATTGYIDVLDGPAGNIMFKLYQTASTPFIESAAPIYVRRSIGNSDGGAQAYVAEVYFSS